MTLYYCDTIEKYDIIEKISSEVLSSKLSFCFSLCKARIWCFPLNYIFDYLAHNELKASFYLILLPNTSIQFCFTQLSYFLPTKSLQNATDEFPADTI